MKVEISSGVLAAIDLASTALSLAQQANLEGRDVTQEELQGLSDALAGKIKHLDEKLKAAGY